MGPSSLARLSGLLVRAVPLPEGLDDQGHADAVRPLDHDDVAGADVGNNRLLQVDRGWRVAAAAIAGQRRPQAFHERAGREHPIDPMRRYRLRERTMEGGAV